MRCACWFSAWESSRLTLNCAVMSGGRFSLFSASSSVLSSAFSASRWRWLFCKLRSACR